MLLFCILMIDIFLHALLFYFELLFFLHFVYFTLPFQFLIFLLIHYLPLVCLPFIPSILFLRTSLLIWFVSSIFSFYFPTTCFVVIILFFPRYLLLDCVHLFFFWLFVLIVFLSLHFPSFLPFHHCSFIFIFLYFPTILILSISFPDSLH